MVITWNTNLVKPQDAPKSYQDLLDPKWKGKMVLDIDPTKEISAMLVAWGEEKTRDYFRRLTIDNQVMVRKGYTNELNSLIAGKFPVAHTLYVDKVESAKVKGAPIDWVAADPIAAGGRGFGIVNKTTRPYMSINPDFTVKWEDTAIKIRKEFVEPKYIK